MDSPWYATWFDSPYYHLLYDHRSDEEAARFASVLVERLRLKPDMQVVDMACGKGRHLREFASHRLDCIGLDLSPESIAEAKKHERCNLHFFQHDMQKSPAKFFQSADLIGNFFTSFGYFETPEQHQNVIHQFTQCLKRDGFFLFDFMNAQKSIQNLVAKEQVIRDGIAFNIRRSYSGKVITKQIDFEDNGSAFQFTERVHAFTEEDFITMFKKEGFTYFKTFGDYALNSFDASTSPRCIIIAQR